MLLNPCYSILATPSLLLHLLCYSIYVQFHSCPTRSETAGSFAEFRCVNEPATRRLHSFILSLFIQRLLGTDSAVQVSRGRRLPIDEMQTEESFYLSQQREDAPSISDPPQGAPEQLSHLKSAQKRRGFCCLWSRLGCKSSTAALDTAPSVKIGKKRYGRSKFLVSARGSSVELASGGTDLNTALVASPSTLISCDDRSAAMISV